MESMDNYSTGKKENELDGCKYIEVDISDSIRRHGAFGLELYRLTKPDVIYHLAALPRIQPSFVNPNKTFDSNVKGTQNIMEYARKLDIPVVYAGSSSSHGDKCANPYTHSKWLGEEVVTMYNKIYNIPTAICRFYNVYGDYQLTEGAYCTVLGIFERLYKNGNIIFSISLNLFFVSASCISLSTESFSATICIISFIDDLMLDTSDLIFAISKLITGFILILLS